MAEESELMADSKTEAENFLDGVLMAIQSSTKFMEIVSRQLGAISQRLDQIEFALMDESKVGKA